MIDAFIGCVWSVRAQTPLADVAPQLRDLGFEPGWGDSVGAVRETMHLLADVIHAPDAEGLQVCVRRAAWPLSSSTQSCSRCAGRLDGRQYAICKGFLVCCLLRSTHCTRHLAAIGATTLSLLNKHFKSWDPL